MITEPARPGPYFHDPIAPLPFDLEKRSPVTPSSAPSISVIIPFYNASAYLERCLKALAGSRHDNYELILVDDGSTDRSPETARRFTDRIITLPSCHGPAFARNRAAEQARGDRKSVV